LQSCKAGIFTLLLLLIVLQLLLYGYALLECV
jgi:hypothetical protein